MKGVLIVEDEAIIRLYLVNLLKRMNIPVLGSVDSGEAAVNSSMELEPDVVFMDIRLAGAMDGIDAAKRILNRMSTRIIFMSAYDHKHRIAELFQGYDVTYLGKPVGAEDLYRVLAGNKAG